MCQQGLPFIWACKSDVEVNQTTILISAFNYGGLCITNEAVEKFFFITEKRSHLNIQKFGLAVIDIKVIVEKLKSFSYIRDFFNIKHSSKMPVSEEALNDTLYNTLHLYIKVWSFTFDNKKVGK